MTAAALVDTNILVYRFDPRFPDKQRRAAAALSRGLAELWSEDFQHGRMYGTVRAVNPLLDPGNA